MSKPSGRGHALKKLGIQVTDLLSQSFNTNGILKKNEYDMFWSQMIQNKESTIFAGEIMNKIIQT